jgi:hypothetical protein
VDQFRLKDSVGGTPTEATGTVALEMKGAVGEGAGRNMRGACAPRKVANDWGTCSILRPAPFLFAAGAALGAALGFEQSAGGAGRFGRGLFGVGGRRLAGHWLNCPGGRRLFGGDGFFRLE